jgi:hypothetical protein
MGMLRAIPGLDNKITQRSARLPMLGATAARDRLTSIARTPYRGARKVRVRLHGPAILSK